MDSRAMFRMDMEFYIGIIVCPLLQCDSPCRGSMSSGGSPENVDRRISYTSNIPENDICNYVGLDTRIPTKANINTTWRPKVLTIYFLSPLTNQT